MTDGNPSQNEAGASSANIGNFPIGILPDAWYPFEMACKMAGIGVKHAEQIKRKYRGKEIRVWGHDTGCFGRDLINIFIAESELSNE